jgi:heme iron utilization protein
MAEDNQNGAELRNNNQNRAETNIATPARDPRQPADFDPIALARMILRATRVGALGTLDDGGVPLVTLVSVATDLAGAPILLVSGLSAHTRNLKRDARCSLLLSQPGKGDPLAHPRLTLAGTAHPVQDEADKTRVRRRFLARHLKAQLYVDFPDFTFLRLEAASIHLNGGFARAYDGAAADILSALPDLAAFDALEQSAIAHMNEDHTDALTLYATQLCGMKGRTWRATGLDPYGLDLARGDDVARIAFDPPVYTGGALGSTLAALAQKARNLSGNTG